MTVAILGILLSAAVTVEGVVERQESRWDEGVIVTRSTVRVDHVVDGAAPARVVVEYIGGAIDGIGQRVSGEATLATGEAVTLDLEQAGDAWRIVGGEAGKRGPAGAIAFVRTTTLSSDPPCSNGEEHPLYWNRLAVPITYDAAFTPEVPAEDVAAALDASLAAWSEPACSHLDLTPVGTIANPRVGYQREGANQNVLTWIQEDWPRNARAIAVTLNTFDCADGRLLDADIIFNGALFSFTADPARRSGTDIRNTATHEIGHLIGFDHSADPASTMFGDAPIDETQKRDLTDDDLLGLCTVYGHAPDDPDDAPPGGCGCGAAGPAAGALPALLAVLGLGVGRRRATRRARGPASAP